jgi:hypothetical protein
VYGLVATAFIERRAECDEVVGGVVAALRSVDDVVCVEVIAGLAVPTAPAIP